MDAETESVKAGILEPDDFPDDDEDGVGNEISRPGDDFRYYAERIRKGNVPIRCTKL